MSNKGLFGSKSIRKGFSSIRNIRQTSQPIETRFRISNQKELNNEYDSRNLNEIILKDIDTFDIDIKQQEASLSVKKKNSRRIDSNIGYGIIKGHGLTNTNRICIVPNNINLYVIPKGQPFTHGINTDENTTIDFRWPINRVSFSSSGCGHLIFGGTPILDMDIKFDPTYIDSDTGYVSGYSFVGIVTGELKFKAKGSTPLITDLDLKKEIVKDEALMTQFEEEAMRSHNSAIIPSKKLYNKKFHLSRVLHKISNFKKSNPNIPSTFILISCRNIIENNIPPCPLLTRHNSNSLNYRLLFLNFVTNIEKKIIDYRREIVEIRSAIRFDQELTKEYQTKIKIYALIKNNLKKIKSRYSIDKLSFELLSIFLFETKKLTKIIEFIARHKLNQS